MFGSPLTSFVDLYSKNLEIEDWVDGEGGGGEGSGRLFQRDIPIPNTWIRFELN